MTGPAERLPRRPLAAFTFVEVLAAMLIMAILLPITLEGISLAQRVGSAAERRRVAVLLADRLLTEAIVTEAWSSGSQSGIVGDDWPDYRFELVAEPWSFESLYQVEVRVFYEVRGQEHEVMVATLASDPQTATTSSSTPAEATP